VNSWTRPPPSRTPRTKAAEGTHKSNPIAFINHQLSGLALYGNMKDLFGFSSVTKILHLIWRKLLYYRAHASRTQFETERNTRCDVITGDSHFRGHSLWENTHTHTPPSKLYLIVFPFHYYHMHERLVILSCWTHSVLVTWKTINDLPVQRWTIRSYINSRTLFTPLPIMKTEKRHCKLNKVTQIIMRSPSK